MSALARYFMLSNKDVAGYDKTKTEITNSLESLGAEIHFDDNVSHISKSFLKPKETLVIYTPAIPNDHSELNYYFRF